MATIGIDLGTSNSAAAVLRGGRPVIIAGTEGVSLGGKAFPSYVAITSDGQMVVGEPARRQAVANPEGTAHVSLPFLAARAGQPLHFEFDPSRATLEEIFTTAADFETTVTVHVFQGERPMSADNTSLGQFNLDGIPPAPHGVPKIEVTFDIDASGILDASAKDLATGRSQSIRITGSTRLPEAEKRRMIEEAHRYAEEDRKRRDAAEKLNAADAIAYQGDKMLADFAGRLSEQQKSAIAAALRELREALSKAGAPAGEERKVVDAEYREAKPR